MDNNLNIFLSEIIDQSINGIIITDPKKQDNPIIYANQSFYKMFGYTQDEVLGKNCRFLQTHKREQKSIDEIRVALKEQKPITTIVLNHKKNGELIQCELSISPIFDKMQYYNIF